MDTGSILLIASVLLLTAMFIGKPLLDRDSKEISDRDRQRSSLLAEREQVLNILQELDFDFKLGKIQQDDYAVQRTQLLTKGSVILKELEAVENAIRKSRPKSVAVERAIADRRAASASGPKKPLVADDELERKIAARRRDRNDQSAGFCPQCGQAIQMSDKFCSKCGASIS